MRRSWISITHTSSLNFISISSPHKVGRAFSSLWLIFNTLQMRVHGLFIHQPTQLNRASQQTSMNPWSNMFQFGLKSPPRRSQLGPKSPPRWPYSCLPVMLLLNCISNTSSMCCTACPAYPRVLGCSCTSSCTSMTSSTTSPHQWTSGLGYSIMCLVSRQYVLCISAAPPKGCLCNPWRWRDQPRHSHHDRRRETLDRTPHHNKFSPVGLIGESPCLRRPQCSHMVGGQVKVENAQLLFNA